jgi:hypothetical protein
MANSKWQIQIVPFAIGHRRLAMGHLPPPPYKVFTTVLRLPDNFHPPPGNAALRCDERVSEQHQEKAKAV